MKQHSGEYLAAVDGLRALFDCVGYVWPISVGQATVCAEYEDGGMTRGEVEEVVAVESWEGAFFRHGRRWLAYAVWGYCPCGCLIKLRCRGLQIPN